MFIFLVFVFLEVFLREGVPHVFPYGIKTQQVPGDFAIIHDWLYSSLLYQVFEQQMEENKGFSEQAVH